MIQINNVDITKNDISKISRKEKEHIFREQINFDNMKLIDILLNFKIVPL